MAGQFPRSRNEEARSIIRQTEFDETESVSTNVLRTLSALPDFDAASSSETLFQHVDPDALDALFRSQHDGDRSEGWVYFPIGDYEVSVSAQGGIVVRTRSR